MRLAASTRSGSKTEGRERVVPGWEREWREAAAAERNELGSPRTGLTAAAWAGLAATAVVGALLPAVLPFSSGYSSGAVQAVAATVAATAAISIVPVSLLAARGRWGTRWSPELVLLYGAALASAGAAAVHFAVAKDHFEQYTLFGLFFVGSAVAQLAWAGSVVLRPSRALLSLAAPGNVLIAALWAVDRIWGVPIGPEHWKPEPVGFGDTVTSALELFVAACCLALMRAPVGARGGVERRTALLLAVPVVVLTTLGLLSVLGVASSVLTPAA